MKKIIKKYRVKDVFTPSTPAKHSFVEREQKTSNSLVKALSTPGKQIIIYGHSGSGKTSLLLKTLERTYDKYIITRCMEGMSFENLIADGFSGLGKYYTEEKTNTKGFKVAPEVSASFLGIQAKLNMEMTSSAAEKQKLLLPPQLTPQQLAKFFGEIKACWVLEDFHKIHPSEKKKASQLMKVFMDTSVEYEDVKLIAIGAVNAGRLVIEYDKEMNNRVSEIHVPLMNSEQLRKIILKGEDLLNINFSYDAIDKIVNISSGLASICHQLCLNICFNRDIMETSDLGEKLTVSDVDAAIEEYIEERSDTLKSQFDKAVKKNKKEDNTNEIKELLSVFCRTDTAEITYEELQTYLSTPPKKFPLHKVKNYLNELQAPDRGEVIVLDNHSGKYSICDPFVKSYAKCKIKQSGNLNMNISAQHFKSILFDEILAAFHKQIHLDVNNLDIESMENFDFDED
ncbi:ATP-binding protein [Rufibacter ruber]|uniref:ATP-binding protein n=1 Tax=Rufibacter ruber TaxID=1783499 RepID=UPI001290766D|nr:ATP-binding protein [Rufibacter ruber]